MILAAIIAICWRGIDEFAIFAPLTTGAIRYDIPTKEYLSLKSLETYEKMADGKATKIVVPSEMQNMASFLTSAREILVDDAAKDALEEVIKPKKG